MTAPTRLEAAVSGGAVGPGTLVGLHHAIKARMEVIAAAFWSLETKATRRAPRVLDFELPPKSSSVEEFPFLIVRPAEGSDGDVESDATFEIIVGTYSDSDDGILDVLGIIDAIRDSLGAAPVLGAFEHVGPLKWAVPMEGLAASARPQWLGRVTLNFNMPRPVRVEARDPT